ncbi:uncharacterized protein LOC130884449 [Chionomys nivalis]|uniref:uncharacterized protein LOC130884449 n=1 Tax=Chionomys nivalis TaxID=269649 RepID=UPI00259AD13B|nr:uncharacterized protein LOC130884449 [Chionomys nivalis]
MGAKSSKPIPPSSPLGQLLEALQPHALIPSVKLSTLIRLCSKRWPSYGLQGNFKWPSCGSFDPDILRELANFCHRSAKWKEMMYIMAFFYMALKTNPSTVSQCSPAHMFLAMPPHPEPPAPAMDPADEPPPPRPRGATPSRSARSNDGSSIPLSSKVSFRHRKSSSRSPNRSPSSSPTGSRSGSTGISPSSSEEASTRPRRSRERSRERLENSPHPHHRSHGGVEASTRPHRRTYRQSGTSSDSSPSPSRPVPRPRSSKAPLGGSTPAHRLAPSFTPPLTRSRAAESDAGQVRPATVLPLREVAGAEGVMRVHVPFALSELSHISKLLGSYTANPTNFTKEFQYLTQSYNLTYHDIFMILSNNLLPEERRRVWEQARLHADEVHQTLASHPPGAEAVPDQEPHWDYNSPGGILARDRFLTCLMIGLRKAALKPVNYSKLAEIFQDTKENPSAFLDRLTKAMLQFTNMDPESTEGRQLLMTHFFNQCYPDIKAKLRRFEKGPLTPQAQALEVAFKVYHARNDKARNHCHVITAPARPAEVTDSTRPVRAAPPPPGVREPPGPCFKCAS